MARRQMTWREMKIDFGIIAIFLGGLAAVFTASLLVRFFVWLLEIVKF